MSRPPSASVYLTFGHPTLEEQPPRPEAPCRLCRCEAWEAGDGTWVCRVCHPLPVPGSQPEAQPWKLCYPKVNAWEGVVQFWIELNKTPTPPFTAPVEKTSQRKGKNVNAKGKRSNG